MKVVNGNIETPSGKNRNTENFPVGSLLIKPSLRKHVHAFYIFARAADDISDNPELSPEEKTARLDRFAEALLDEEVSDIPSVIPLRESLKVTGITPQHSLDLLTAFKRDAKQLRYRDWDDLMDYCRYSASPVGRHVLALHGIGEGAWPSNDALCSALQVINHMQDCADDYAKLNRVYIPQDMLIANGGKIEDLAGKHSTPELRATFDAMLNKLDPMLNIARGLPCVVSDPRLKMETSIICCLAERLTNVLRQRDPLCDCVKLNKLSFFSAALAGIFRAWF